MKTFIHLMEKGYLPDFLIRRGIRNLNTTHLRNEYKKPVSQRHQEKQLFINELCESPLAIHTSKANEQHYELPPKFFNLVLGKRKKYSSCFWGDSTRDLDQAEEDMLNISCQNAQVEDGMEIMDLGCGWGSLSLWLAEHYPNCTILSVSNSNPQREYIQQQCREKNFANVEVITADINHFATNRQFDRIMSIEMFEHLRNHRVLFNKLSSWLKPNGKLFIHVFCHKELLYPFTTGEETNWLAEYFFTGGLMPSEDLFLHYQQDFLLQNWWKIDGTHYQKTSRAWLENQDKHRSAIMKIFEDIYGASQTEIWFNRWRVFFMACEELFGHNKGQEWFVAHYLFNKRSINGYLV